VSEFRVALTFDAEHPDRPTRPGVLESILETLGAAGARSTFFLQGRWVEAQPEGAVAIARAGHLIGNHSFYHARMPLLTDSGFTTDVLAAERVIRKVTRTDPRPWFRCPFGAGEDDDRTAQLLARKGYRNVGWNVTGYDWLQSLSGRGLARNVVADVTKKGDGSVVLLHSWPRPTAVALPEIINNLRAAGARFVGVDELLPA
jgi:peptidoglycan-N-acetylglucosamine deacetylase